MNWQTLLAIDFDRWAALTYRANFPGVEVRCASVADEISNLPDADVILGGPPCQPHSTAGKRQASKDKRDCGPDFVAAIAKKKPRMFLMENVDGLMSSENGLYAQRLFAGMEAAGYVVQVKILDAVDFGVPQFRVRCWWWGIRSDLYRDGMRHRWPIQTHVWPAQQPSMFGGDLLTGITVGQALSLNDFDIRRIRGSKRTLRPITEPSTALGNDSRHELKVKSHADPAQTIHKPSPTLRSGGGSGHDGCCLRLQGHGNNSGGPFNPNQPAPTMRNCVPGCSDIEIYYDHGVAVLDEPSPTLKAGGNYSGGKQGGRCPPIIEYRWSDEFRAKHPPADRSAPSCSVKANWGRGGAEGLLQWKKTDDGLWVRRLMPLECARLQSAPDNFQWPENIGKTAMYKIVGNGWATRMGHVFSMALAETDPDSSAVIDLFCGGGLGAVGWHGRFWSYESEQAGLAVPA